MDKHELAAAFAASRSKEEDLEIIRAHDRGEKMNAEEQFQDEPAPVEGDEEAPDVEIEPSESDPAGTFDDDVESPEQMSGESFQADPEDDEGLEGSGE